MCLLHIRPYTFLYGTCGHTTFAYPWAHLSDEWKEILKIKETRAFELTMSSIRDRQHKYLNHCSSRNFMLALRISTLACCRSASNSGLMTHTHTLERNELFTRHNKLEQFFFNCLGVTWGRYPVIL
jgi:hypothetical protein